MAKRAVVIGATGLVGSHLIRLLTGDPNYQSIMVFARRSLELNNPKLEEHIVDFDEIDSWKKDIKGDVLFSTMGTTIKKAGSKKVQYKIDFTYQFEVAKAAAQQGVRDYFLVSSLGANPKSNIFYSRMKGDLDEAVQQLPFNSVNIIRPSVLAGNRLEKRSGEAALIKVASFLVKILPFLKKHKPIPAKTVAQAMLNLDAQALQGISIINNTELFTIAKT